MCTVSRLAFVLLVILSCSASGLAGILGVCCFEDGSCQDLDRATCLMLGGFPQVDEVSCAEGVCDYAVGDINCDGSIDFNDLDAFVLRLTDEAAFERMYPGCDPLAGDMNDDTYVDFTDIDLFVTCLVTSRPGGPPPCGRRVRTRIRNFCPALPTPDDPAAAGPNAVGWIEDISFPNAVRAGAAPPGVPGAPVFPEITAATLDFDGQQISGAFIDSGVDLLPGFDIRAQVRYPAAGAGGLNARPAGTGAFPVVVIAHGNHGRFTGGPDPSDENYRGYTYLQDALAQRGYLSISLGLDDFTSLFPGILSRAWLVLCHIENLERINGLAGHVLQGRIDLGNITLVGHSRGGDCVVRAQMMNESVGTGNPEVDGPAVGPGAGEGRFAIRAVISLAPTRFFDGTVDYGGGVNAESRLATAIPFLGMWGDDDGDVSGGDTQLPAIPGLGLAAQRSTANHVLGAYDRSPPGPKQLAWVEGANHNHWNTSWPADGGNVAITINAAQQRDLLVSYGQAFIRGYAGGEAALLDYFRFAAEQLPPAGTVAAARVHLQYQDTAARRLVVDDFQANPALGTTSTGEAGVDTTTLVGPPAEPELIGANRAADATQSYFHHTRGVLFEWNAAADFYRTIPPGVAAAGRGIDVSANSVLSFRVTQDRRDAASAAPLDLIVKLRDGRGREAQVRTSTITAIPVHQTRTDDADLTKSMLKTIRIPLCRFRNDQPRLNLRNIDRIQFEFGRATGKIALDDIEFAR